MSKHLIVITGASSGIGNSLAQECAHRGYEVLAIARREHLLQQLANSNKLIHPLAADVSTAVGRGKIVEFLQEYKKNIYIVNNAAVVMPKKLVDLTEEEWQIALSTNFEGPMWLINACTEFYDHSRVLNISSGLAHHTLPGSAAYSMTKAALYMFYQVINVEFTPDKLIAGSLRPGIIDTPMQQHLRTRDIADFPSRDIFTQFHAQKQLRSPEKVAQFIANVLLDSSDEKFKEQEWDIDEDKTIRE